ncbi:BRCT domain-containing protein [Rhodotorula toruloides]|uniref:BRCT domain-containing protein n=1 Tax=Rhodotorula toruloides TaxID=5286 RepID=A0A2T0A8S3_RHOTO|nr:BRCT domain-containing protein [Rhodotorula toruloides]PRQ74403.1 hypothetical protein AAT19DRAFT_14756 [Rhodotorula toruloides]
MDAYLTATKPSTASSMRAKSAKPSASSARPGPSSSNRPTLHSSSTARANGVEADPSRRDRSTSVNPAKGKKRLYDSLTVAPKPSSSSTTLNLVQGGLREANKAIINTLGKEDNPITNSTAYSRSLHVSSCATGHQSGGGPGRKWSLHRNAKLRLQAASAESQTLKGVVAYISGYTGKDITNTQLKELVERQGGQFVTMASARCTHIFITQNLSGKKAQHYLEARRKNGTKLVTPEWAIECAKRVRRVGEAKFAAPVYNEQQESTYTIFARDSGSSSTAAPPIQPPQNSASASTSNTLLPALPIASPSTSSSSRPSKLPLPPSRPTTSPKTATSLLLSQLAHSKSRSPSLSPGKKRRRGHVAGWETWVMSPGTERRVRGSADAGGNGKGKGKEGDKGKEKAREEEVLVLGSSDVEEEAGPSSTRELRPRKELTYEDEDQGEDEDELDEWGMPPSAQMR